MLFTFDEVQLSEGAKTGNAESYDARTSREAALMCLEHHWNVESGLAEMGPMGHVIYPQGRHGHLALVLRSEQS